MILNDATVYSRPTTGWAMAHAISFDPQQLNRQQYLRPFYMVVSYKRSQRRGGGKDGFLRISLIPKSVMEMSGFDAIVFHWTQSLWYNSGRRDLDGCWSVRINTVTS
jgi:hypothetical protein